jgi:hypothetical protein
MPHQHVWPATSACMDATSSAQSATTSTVLMPHHWPSQLYGHHVIGPVSCMDATSSTQSVVWMPHHWLYGCHVIDPVIYTDATSYTQSVSTSILQTSCCHIMPIQLYEFHVDVIYHIMPSQLYGCHVAVSGVTTSCLFMSSYHVFPSQLLMSSIQMTCGGLSCYHVGMLTSALYGFFQIHLFSENSIL